MDYHKLKVSLKEDQAEGNGEILYENEKGIAYYDYNISCGDDFLFFRKPELCTKEELEKLIFCDQDCIDRGVKPSIISDILVEAYGEQLMDMMAVLRGIVVFHYYSGLEEGIKFFGQEDDEGEFDITDHLVGKTWFRKQMAFVYAGNIATSSEAMEDPISSYSELYTDGIGTTVIHETRHIMLDCNPFLDEGDYPVELSSEENVENFCREKWDNIRSNYFFAGRTLKRMEEEVYKWINVSTRWESQTIKDKAQEVYDKYKEAGGTHEYAFFEETLSDYLFEGHCGY